MILDSCFLIDLMAGDDGAIAKLDELTQQAVPVSISSLTVAEVGTGLRNKRERERFERLADQMTVVAFEHRDGRRTARIQRELGAAGQQIGVLDAMIAATAIERSEPVVTRNVSEFNRVEDVRVSPY